MAVEYVNPSSGTVDKVQWVLSDHQGSIRDVYWIDGQDNEQINTIEYSAFGEPITAYPFNNLPRALYAGREFDPETWLYYNRARYYDPDSGRFLSGDPLSIAVGDSNLYRYAFNSPTHFTDPSGQVIPLLLLGGLALAGIGVGVTNHYANEMNIATGGTGYIPGWTVEVGPIREFDDARYNRAVTGFGIGLGITGAGFALAAAPAFSVAGSSLATFGGWSSTGYVAAAWTFGLDAGVTGTFYGGISAYSKGATPWQTAQAAYTTGRDSLLSGMIAGPLFHGGSQLVGAGLRYGKSIIAPRGGNRVIYNLTDDFEKIVRSERVWGLTEGSVYGLRTRQWWRGWLSRFDMPRKTRGRESFWDAMVAPRGGWFAAYNLPSCQERWNVVFYPILYGRFSQRRISNRIRSHPSQLERMFKAFLKQMK